MTRRPPLVLVPPSVLAGALAGALALLGPGGTATAVPGAGSVSASVELEVVADSDADGFDPFEFGCAGINNGGGVVFRAARPHPDGFNIIDGIYRVGPGGGLVTIAENEDRFALLGRNPSLNNRGQVSFAARLEAGGEAVFRGSGGRLTTIARTEPGRFDFFGFDTSLNDGGRVAFMAELDEEFDFEEGLFSGEGGTVRTHYLASTSRFDGTGGRPSINRNDRIAFTASVEFDEGVFVTRPGGFRTVSPPSSEVGVGDPLLDNRGRVAFERSFSDPVTGEFVTQIVAGRAQPFTVVADTREAPSSFGFRPPSLADDGGIAYLADLDDLSSAVILEHLDDPTAPGQVVARTGDILDGDPVTNLVFCEEGLATGGGMVFVATLEDPDTPSGTRVVVVRATPAP